MRPTTQAESQKVMRERYGKDIGSYEEGFLSRSLSNRAAALTMKDESSYPQYLAEHPEEADRLLASLSITYSEFFREPLSFALLERLVVPSILEAKGGASGIRAWSAGCACGQEAYSLAIILDEAASCRSCPAGKIFATDLSAEALKAAARGLFCRESLDNLRLRHLDAYFSRLGQSYEVAERLRRLIDFSVHDLLAGDSAAPQASIYGEFDLVLCRNVLLYYSADARRLMLDRLKRTLAPGGYLVLGETERGCVGLDPSLREAFPASPIYRDLQGRRMS